MNSHCSEAVEYPKIHNDGTMCYGGHIYLSMHEKKRELERRGVDPEGIKRAIENNTHNFVKPCPDCQAVKFLKRYVGGRDMTWLSWVDREPLRDAVRTLDQWVSIKSDPALLIHGNDSPLNCANGKTHAVIARAVDMIKSGKRVTYINAADIIERRFERSQVDDLGNNQGLLIIDDLGSEPSTPGTRDMIDRIMDMRIRLFLPLIAVTKKSLSGVMKDYHRFGSRIVRGSKIFWECAPYE